MSKAPKFDSYGLIVITRDSRKVLLLYNKKGFWDYPKGKPKNSHERPLATALREFKEETGLSPDLITVLSQDNNTMDYSYPISKGRMKKVRLFFSEIESENGLIFNHDREIQSHLFVSLEQLVHKMKYTEDKELAQRIHQHFAVI